MEENKEVINLSKIEKIIVQGLLAREREINEKFAIPLREDFEQAFTEMEKSHNLDAGAISKDYNLNIESWTLVKRKTEEIPKQN